MQAPTHVEQFTNRVVTARSPGLCWRPDCRRANGPYRTVAYMPGNIVIARCHKGEYRNLFDLAAELWAHAG